MKKVNQPTDSVNTSGLFYGEKVEEIVVVPETLVTKEEPLPVEKVDVAKVLKKKILEDDDVVLLSKINKASNPSED